ncbi:MAG TPA: hypothetical protein DEB74_12510 [Lachnospiraceae bacterium]|nr:hypothetical protein [Lachnospiraceae bacterium]
MIIPEKVKILYKEYEIEQREGLHDEGGELYGQINYLSQKIYLNKEALDEQKKATLIHEIVHGLDEMYNIGLKEEDVEKLGVAFYTFVKENPTMFQT